MGFQDISKIAGSAMAAQTVRLTRIPRGGDAPESDTLDRQGGTL